MSKKNVNDVIPGSLKGHVQRWAAQYIEARNLVNKYDKERKELMAKIQDAFNNEEAEGELGSFRLSSWIEKRSRKKFDEGALKKEPKLYGEYMAAKALVESVEEKYSEVSVSESFRVRVTSRG